jgi:hypothetical protein
MPNISSLIYKEISLFIIYLLIASSVLLPTGFSHAQTRTVVGISHPSKVVILTFGDTHNLQTPNQFLINTDSKGAFYYLLAGWVIQVGSDLAGYFSVTEGRARYRIQSNDSS